MTPWLVLVAAVALLRLVELAIAGRNTRRLKAAGAIEFGRRHYPLFVLLHASWLVALVVFVHPHTPLDPFWLAVTAVLMAGRFWVIASLGRFWTTRVISLPGAPLVRRGPYRWIRHPNYLVVIGEIVALPMVAGVWEIALAFSVPNLALLWWRWRVEEAAIAGRRRLTEDNAS